MALLPPGRKRTLVRAILAWYAREGRKLPWRDCPNPYHVLLSEIMLQQTQVSRVLVKHPAFLAKFPTLHTLSSSPQREVVIAWQGMGYNNRAVRLHLLARTLTEDHSGRLPASYEALVALPGIGRYTANALLSSVHGADVPVVDVNVRRFLSRLFWRMPDRSSLRPEKEIWPLAQRLVPKGRGYPWSQALMDLGATICTARRPACAVCPVAAWCASRAALRREPPHGALTRRSAAASRKTRAQRRAVSDRLARGRIIELLRTEQTPGGTTVRAIGEKIFSSVSRPTLARLEKLLAALAKDGLLSVRGTGGAQSRRVVLA